LYKGEEIRQGTGDVGSRGTPGRTPTRKRRRMEDRRTTTTITTVEEAVAVREVVGKMQRNREEGVRVHGPDDRGEKPREKSREPPRSNRKSGRERKALQAKELQMLYRRAAKKCVEKILGATEDRKVCKIPLPDIHSQMSESYSTAVRGPTKPSWVRDPEREQTDVLDGSFTTEKVRR